MGTTEPAVGIFSVIKYSPAYISPMSRDIGMGVRARKILTVMAAVFAVALMIVVPVFAAVDIDADFKEDKVGYSVKLDEPTDIQLEKVGWSKSMAIRLAIEDQLIVFNQPIFGDPVIKTESFRMVTAKGEEIDSDKTTYIYDLEVIADDVTITYTAVAPGPIVNTFDDGEAKYKAAAEAIKGEFGENAVIGDKLVFKGDIKFRYALQSVREAMLLDDGKFVASKDTSVTYIVNDIDMDVEFVSGSTEKEIDMVSTFKGALTDEDKYGYDASPVTAGTTYTKKNSVDMVKSGDVYFEIHDRKYSLVSKPVPGDDETGTAVLLDQEKVVISPELNTEIDNLPASEKGMKIDKTYDAAESAFDSIVMDAVGNDLLKMLLIIGGVIIGVIVLIIILIIVLLVIRKKKKKQ